MLIFLRSDTQGDNVITTAMVDIVVAETQQSRYTNRFAAIAAAHVVIVPWYELDDDPEVFGRRVLTIAAADPVCVAILARATTVWGVDFAIEGNAFRTREVQAHYLKQLKIWLSPLSGNLGHRDAHRSDVDAQYARLWQQHGLDRAELRRIAALEFFRSVNVAGRRDRIQIYRNIREAARALIGEVTSWPSRAIEKIAMFSLLHSPGLAALQRQMLDAVATAVANNTLQLGCTRWEYLPYYLRGVPLEVVADGVARPRVLGALHDCLHDGDDTRAHVDDGLRDAFIALAGGAEYRRWRLLPAVVRNQVLISDLARIVPGGPQNRPHQRMEYGLAGLQNLPTLDGFAGWPVTMVAQPRATPHDPGHQFPHAAGWSRNELCPNVISSRLLLAPLYAGTSGHNQGRILTWTNLAATIPALNAVPLGIVISAGYSVLWRIYYDKRVSGFHTMFETFQGSHVDLAARDLSARPRIAGDVMWNAVLDCSVDGRANMRDLWGACLRLFGRRGAQFARLLKLDAARAREAALAACPGAVIPRWNTTGDVNRTGPEVDVWAPAQNQAVIREYEAWLELVRAPPVPRPLPGTSIQALVEVVAPVPRLSQGARLQIEVDIAGLLGLDHFLGESETDKLFKRWLIKNTSDRVTDTTEKRERDEKIMKIRALFDQLREDRAPAVRRLTGPSQVPAIEYHPDVDNGGGNPLDTVD